MFVNDLSGVCRSNIFGGDITTQIPQINPWGQIPVGLGTTIPYGVGTQVYHPGYGVLLNRFAPQGMVPQNFLPQGMVPQGFVPQAFGGVNTIPVNHPYFAIFASSIPFTNPFLAQSGLVPTNVPYTNPLLAQSGLGASNVPFANPFLAQSGLGASNVPFTNPFLAHAGLTSNTLGYTPFGAANWNSQLGFQGGICR